MVVGAYQLCGETLRFRTAPSLHKKPGLKSHTSNLNNSYTSVCDV